ncbi:MAG: 6-phosphofructokinase, partial [Vicinamibacteria bacterium]
MRIGVLTGGGDCPGLNAVIRAVVQRAVRGHRWEVVGIRHGWRGLLVDEVEPLDLSKISGILPRGGTILGTSRTNPLKEPDGIARIRASMEAHGLGALVVIGGEDTLGAASALSKSGL